jgi:hypothetical protein
MWIYTQMLISDLFYPADKDLHVDNKNLSTKRGLSARMQGSVYVNTTQLCGCDLFAQMQIPAQAENLPHRWFTHLVLYADAIVLGSHGHSKANTHVRIYQRNNPSCSSLILMQLGNN